MRGKGMSKEERGSEEWKGTRKGMVLGEKVDWERKGMERKRYMKKGKERKETRGERRQGTETGEERK